MKVFCRCDEHIQLAFCKESILDAIDGFYLLS